MLLAFSLYCIVILVLHWLWSCFLLAWLLSSCGSCGSRVVGMSVARYADLGEALQFLNGGSFPPTEDKVLVLLVKLYSDINSNLPPCWEWHVRKSDSLRRPRFKCTFRLFGRECKVRAPTLPTLTHADPRHLCV